MRSTIFALAALCGLAQPAAAQTAEDLVMTMLFAHVKGHSDNEFRFRKYTIEKRGDCVYHVTLPDDDHELTFDFGKFKQVHHQIEGKNLILRYQGDEGFFVQKKGQNAPANELRSYSLSGHVAIVPPASLSDPVAKAREQFFATVCKRS